MEEPTPGKIVIHDLDSHSSQGYPPLKFFSFLALVISAGLIVGYLFSLINKTATSKTPGLKKDKVEKTAGIADKKTFKDKAEGILKEGGVEGEGNFHLQRPGGDSQNVYLTSTTVDLTQYLGKKIRIWGETFQAEKAGWLMDVGLVEVLQ